MCLGILSNGAAGPKRYECVAHQPWDKASPGSRTNDFTMGLYIFLPFLLSEAQLEPSSRKPETRMRLDSSKM